MKHVKTSAGFEADIDENQLDDMELFDAIAEVDRGNKLALSKVTDIILGDRKRDMYETCRKENGKVGIAQVMTSVNEIIEQLGGKNS